MKTLASRHSLFATALFQNPELLRELEERVHCGIPKEGKGLQATGIPPHVSLLSKLTHLHQASQETVNKIAATKDEIILDIVKELEDRAIGARTVTYDGLQDTIRKCFKEVGIDDLVHRSRNPCQEGRVTVPNASNIRERLAHYWGGRFRRLPEDFSFLDITARQLWLLWVCGDETRNIRPLRFVDHFDVSTLNMKKRLSDARFLMNKVVERAKLLGKWKEKYTQQQAVETYNQCGDVIEIPKITRKQRKRRRTQLSWLTVCKNVRQQKVAAENPAL